MFLLLLTAGGVGASTVSDIAGEWRSGIINGLSSPAGQPGCKSFGWIERELHLLRVPGSPNLVRGRWQTTQNAVWTDSNNGSCRWNREPVFVPNIRSANDFSLTGSFDPSSGILKVTTVFADCSGCSPERPAAFMAPVDQQFRFENGALVDADPVPVLSYRVRFIRTGDAIDSTFESVLVADQALALLEGGQIGKFLKDFASESFLVGISPGQLANSWSEMVPRRGKILSRKFLGSSYACSTSVDIKRLSDAILLIRRVETSTNKTITEFVTVQKEHAQWKILFIEYA